MERIERCSQLSISPDFSHQPKKLTLSITPSYSNSIYNDPMTDASESLYQTHEELMMNPMQGTNTNEYFGHGEMYPSDPYDNINGEQKFCGGFSELGGHVMTNNERTILPDLKSYLYTDDIKNQSDVIFNKMKYQVRRGKIRNQMLFFCVYCSHLELGLPVNPIQLGADFKLTSGEVQRCDSLFSPLQTGYKPPATNVSPLGYLPDYCQNMDLSQDAVEEIMKISTNILRKDHTLFQENPQTVAAGLLRYYTVTKGIVTDDPQKITRVTKRSNVTIDGMFRRISTIDNS